MCDPVRYDSVRALLEQNSAPAEFGSSRISRGFMGPTNLRLPRIPSCSRTAGAKFVSNGVPRSRILGFIHPRILLEHCPSTITALFFSSPPAEFFEKCARKILVEQNLILESKFCSTRALFQHYSAQVLQQNFSSTLLV